MERVALLFRITLRLISSCTYIYSECDPQSAHHVRILFIIGFSTKSFPDKGLCIPQNLTCIIYIWKKKGGIRGASGNLILSQEKSIFVLENIEKYYWEQFFNLTKYIKLWRSQQCFIFSPIFSIRI